MIPFIPLSLSFFSLPWALGRDPSLQLLLSPVLCVILLQIFKISLGLEQEKLKCHETSYYVLLRPRKKKRDFIIFTLKLKWFGSWVNFYQGA